MGGRQSRRGRCVLLFPSLHEGRWRVPCSLNFDFDRRFCAPEKLFVLHGRVLGVNEKKSKTVASILLHLHSDSRCAWTSCDWLVAEDGARCSSRFNVRNESRQKASTRPPCRRRRFTYHPFFDANTNFNSHPDHRGGQQAENHRRIHRTSELRRIETQHRAHAQSGRLG